MDLLKSADPWQGGARQTTVADALAEGVKQVDAGRIADPVVAASVRRTIATAYQGLGRIAEADTLIQAGLRERIARTGPASEETAESWNDLGILLTTQGKLDSAEAALERALAIRRGSRRRGHGHGRHACSTSPTWPTSKGESARGRLAGARGARHPSAGSGRTPPRRGGGHGPGPVDPAGHGELAKAESTGRAAAAMLRELGLERHPQMVPILSDLAITLANQGE